MRRIMFLSFLIAVIVMPVAWLSAQDETLELVTYYPAPYGVYKELHSTNNATLATEEGSLYVGGTTNRHWITIDSKQWPELRYALNGTELWRLGTAHADSSTYGVEQGDWYIYDRSENNMAFIVKNDNNGILLCPNGVNSGNVGIGANTSNKHMLDIASTKGATNNSAIRALYPGGGRLTNTEFGALAHRDGEWSAVYAKAGDGPSTAVALYTDGKVNMMNGNVGIGTTTPMNKLHVIGSVRISDLSGSGNRKVKADSDGVLSASGSSIKYKKNVRDLPIPAKKLFNLRPIKFNWKDSGQEDIGLIAEEVDEQIKDLVIYDKEGNPDGVKYEMVSLYLLEVLKEQQKRIEVLEEKIAQLEGK